MIEFVALPLLLLYPAAYAATCLHHLLPARAAAWSATIALTLLLTTGLPTIWLIAVSGLRHIGIDSPFADWSQHLLPTAGPAGALIGLGASLLTAVGLVRARRVLRLHSQLRSSATSVGPEVLPSPAVFAYTLPGPKGNIVLSDGLIDALTDSEYSAVLAHERSHVRHRHDRHLLLAKLSVAFLPIARHLADRLEYSLERWADQDAAAELGDSRLVAKAIARVALVGTHPTPLVPGIARLGSAARAHALLDPRPTLPPALFAAVVSTAAFAITVLSSALQIHHTLQFGASLFR